jgi:release factor glutamine methyltransferase
MTVGEWIRTATKELASVSATSHLDVTLLIAYALGVSRSWALAHPDEVLKGPTLRIVDGLLKRRMAHEPIAYITGHAEFYGRDFFVTRDTLQPRPESETIIDQLLGVCKGRNYTTLNLVDVGTGSGCLGITAWLELNKSFADRLRLSVCATDISDAALAIARKNAKRLGADVRFYHGDLLEPVENILQTGPCIILANLPYVPNSHTINEAARHEPDIALFGGHDGLDLYRRMFKQHGLTTAHELVVITESLPSQHDQLSKLASKYGFSLLATDDFIQVFQK